MVLSKIIIRVSSVDRVMITFSAIDHPSSLPTSIFILIVSPGLKIPSPSESSKWSTFWMYKFGYISDLIALLILSLPDPNIPDRLLPKHVPSISSNWSVLPIILSITACLSIAGNLDHNNAIAPDVIGEENEVPNTVLYPPWTSVVIMFLPGAQRSTVGPAVAQQPKLSPGSTAETLITFSQDDGVMLSKLVCPFTPPFPEPATKITS